MHSFVVRDDKLKAALSRKQNGKMLEETRYSLCESCATLDKDCERCKI